MSTPDNQFSPEFEAFSPEAVQFVVDHGAAKLSNILTYASLVRLTMATPDEARDFERLLTDVPELRPIDDYFNTAINRDLGISRGTKGIPLRGVAPGQLVDGHQDGIRYGGLKGFTLLMPYIGGSALFGASQAPFCMSKPLRGTPPPLIWNYGPHDVIITRQALEEVNDQPVDLGQTYHVGISHRNRIIRGINYSGSRWSLPDIELAA